MPSLWKADLCGIGPAILIEASIITAAAYKGSATLKISKVQFLARRQAILSEVCRSVLQHLNINV
jgi:hypothetical protein